MGGITGNLLTGLFAADYIARLDGHTQIDGGFLNQNYIQLAKQLADSVAGLAYSFLGTCIILLLINFIPGLHIRASEEDEIMGIDDAEIGEFAVCSTLLSLDFGGGGEDFGPRFPAQLLTFSDSMTMSSYSAMWSMVSKTTAPAPLRQFLCSPRRFLPKRSTYTNLKVKGGSPYRLLMP